MQDRDNELFRSNDIKGCVFFQDFRKIGSEDRLITSIQTTITKRIWTGSADLPGTN